MSLSIIVMRAGLRKAISSFNLLEPLLFCLSLSNSHPYGTVRWTVTALVLLVLACVLVSHQHLTEIANRLKNRFPRFGHDLWPRYGITRMDTTRGNYKITIAGPVRSWIRRIGQFGVQQVLPSEG